MNGPSPEILREHDRQMATPPIAYRGCVIRPMSLLTDPFPTANGPVYWGWKVVDAEGDDAAPGAAWGETIAAAQRIVDCLHEAGPKPIPASAAASRSWESNFFSLLRANPR